MSKKQKTAKVEPIKAAHEVTLMVTGREGAGWSWSVAYKEEFEESNRVVRQLDEAVNLARGALHDLKIKEATAQNIRAGEIGRAAQAERDAARRAQFPPLEVGTLVRTELYPFREGRVPMKVVEDAGPGYDGARHVVLRRADGLDPITVKSRADRLTLIVPADEDT